MMKICVLLCSFLVAYCYGNTIPDSAKIGTTVCNPVDFDQNEVGFNKYITNSLRSQVCAKRIFLYNAKARIPVEFLGEEHNEVSRQNPCSVVCRYDSATESVIDPHANLDPTNHLAELEHATAYTLEEYGTLTEAVFRLGANIACGPQHMCDAHGCCVREEEVTKQEDPKPVTEVETTVEQHKLIDIENLIHCTAEGYFRNEYDCNRFYRCYYNDDTERSLGPLRLAHFVCQPGMVFDTVEHVCVLPHMAALSCNNKVIPQEPIEPPQYENMMSCSVEGYFRNPYDCSLFYRCYYNDESERQLRMIRMANFRCPAGLVFDNSELVCVLPEHTKEVCSNKAVTQVPVAPPQYENMIKCTHEGYYRNPFDCHSFYRCYYNDEMERNAGEIRVANFKCANGLVFDNTVHVCVLPEASAACSNHVVPQEPVAPPQYENMLQCTHEGWYRNPFDCNRFYRCYYNDNTERMAGEIRMANFKCADGLVFDTKDHVCVLPENTVQTCANKVVTQEPATPPQYENMLKCSHEGYFRNPYDCNKFYRCYYNDESERSAGKINMANFRCHESLVFDPIAHICTLPETTVQACSNQPITQLPVSPPVYENLLKCTVEGYFRNPYNCNRFFRCYFNDQSERMANEIRMANFKCQEGLVFDPKDHVCVLPEMSVQTCDNKAVNQEPVVPPQYDNMIKCTHEGWFRNPFNCNQFYRCYYNDQSERALGAIRTAHFSCAHNMVFHSLEHTCVLPQAVSESCTNQAVTQEPTKQPDYVNMLQCTHEGYFRNPYDCNKFVRCYFNDETERRAGKMNMANFRCADGLVFDNTERVCVRPETSVAVCSNAPVTQEPTLPPNYENMIKCSHEGFFRNPYDCSRFYRCYYNDEMERNAGEIRVANFKCADGLVFDNREQVCVRPESTAESCSNSPVTQEPSTPPQYENMLKCTHEGYFRNPYNCNQFFRCYVNDENERSSGILRMATFSCASGLVFDNNERVCVLPEATSHSCHNNVVTQDPVSPPNYENMIKCTQEGWYRNPHDCNRFFRCYYNDQTERNAGEIRLANFKCHDGMVFDTRDHVCVLPENTVQQCSNQPITQEPTTPPQYENMLQCTLEGFYSNPYDCNRFYRCYFNDQSERSAGLIRMANFKCQDGLVFDTRDHVCVLPEMTVQACSNLQVTQDHVSPPYITRPYYDNLLECQTEGYFRNPYDCNKFFRCYYNDESERMLGELRMANFKCQDGLVFDNSNRVCVKSENSAACINIALTQEPVEPVVTYELVCSHEGYFRNPYDCNRFYRCYYNDQTERSTKMIRVANFKCQDGLVFDTIHHVCVLPHNAEGCNNKQITSSLNVLLV